MKKVMVWVDCKDEKVEDIRREIESFLKSQGYELMVDVCDLVSADKWSK